MSSEDLDQGTAVDAVTDETTTAKTAGIVQWLRNLSVRSKFLIMMLLTSLLSLATVSVISYTVGREALVREVFNQLTSLNASKKQQVEEYFENMRNTIGVLGENILVAQAVLSFTSGMQALDTTPASEEQIKRLTKYYKEEFIPRVTDQSSALFFVEQYMPRSPLARSMQASLISDNPHPVGKKANLIVPGEFNNYALTHEAHHIWFRTLAKKHQFYDVFLIDAKSDRIVYSVEKEVDFGTSLSDGPYAQSNLGRLYRKVKEAPRRGSVEMSDYERYVPSYNDPAGFIATPLFSGRRFVGVLAAQISTEAVNNFMNSNKRWAEQGLGESGETYLVGPDNLMRSNSRFLIQDKEKLERDLKRHGVQPGQIARALSTGSTVLGLPVKTTGVRLAQAGVSGTKIYDDYRGISVLGSYASIEVPGLNWVLLAEMDEVEAMKPQQDFQRLLMLAAAGLTLLVTLGSMLLSHMFLRPVNTLISGIAELRSGKTDVKVESLSDDEFGELTGAFNAMAAEIRKRDETIKGKSRAYETLLKRIFPETVAERLKKGKGKTVDSFPQVSVVYVILSGLDSVAVDSDGQTSFDLLNEVVEMFDAEAERIGIEKVKTIGEHYLATCGLTVPRLDHARLVMQFLDNISAGIRRHNQDHETKLSIRAGIHSGLVHAGIVGSRQFVYDVWGPSVNVARRIVYEADLGSLCITENTARQLGDQSGLTDISVIKTRSLGEIQTRTKTLDLGIAPEDLFDLTATAPRAAE